MQKAISIFKNSAGALLLALATALFLTNFANPVDSILPHDPILLMPLSHLFSIIGGTAAIAALVCFFSTKSMLPLSLTALVGFEYVLCRVVLFYEGCPGLTGYLEGFSRAFGVSAGGVNAIADVAFVYLVIGSYIAFWLEGRLPPPVAFQKMPCPACGGHVKFSVENLGQKIDCPHCAVPVTLRRPEEILKMFCFFCKEHIEFPAHALGRKIKCPHCKMEIGLKEPV